MQQQRELLRRGLLEVPHRVIKEIRVLEMDAQFVSGEKGHWHVFFRESSGAHYCVNFSPDGTFGFHKDLNGVGTTFAEYRVSALTFGQGFGTTNHLTIIAQGPQIVVYVNGEPLGFVHDESSSSGMVSLAVENAIVNTTLQVYFDNFKVWDISGLELPALTPIPTQTAGTGGSGVFADSGQNLGSSDSAAVALGDLDNDGDVDAFVANALDQANRVWLDDGTGLFTDSDQNLGGFDTIALALGDLDSDGDLDAFWETLTIKRTESG